MMSAIAAKVFGQVFQGVEGVVPVMIVFLAFGLIAVFSSFHLLMNMKESN